MRRVVWLSAIVAVVAALLVPASSAGAAGSVAAHSAAPTSNVHPMAGCQVAPYPDPYYPLAVCDYPVAAGYAPVGAICSKTEHLVKSGHPTYTDGNGKKYTDLYMTVWLWYSIQCKNIWIEAKNTKAIGRVACTVEVGTIGWAARDYDCPAAGHAIHTVGWDDYCPTNCTIAYGDLWEHLPNYIFPEFYAAY